LEDIHRFVDKEQAKGFFKSLLKMDSRIASIEVFYRRIGITVNAFQVCTISAPAADILASSSTDIRTAQYSNYDGKK
jgi:hypothetical protein